MNKLFVGLVALASFGLYAVEQADVDGWNAQINSNKAQIDAQQKEICDLATKVAQGESELAVEKAKAVETAASKKALKKEG